jgi:glycosyltransferase involved in cell wall biosynthesis
MKILFLVPYPLQEAPSQRFRFEQYFEILVQNGHTIKTQSFLQSHTWQLFFTPGKPLLKAQTLILGFLKRCYALIVALSFDFIFIHREAAPIGPPIFEWIIAKVLRKKIIYDFDDAIWLTDKVNEPRILKLLKWRKKVKAICSWSHKISCGNQYLKNFALKYNSNSIYNPTTIDCEHKHNPTLYKRIKIDKQLVIGWTGSHSTLKYLIAIEPALQKLEHKFPLLSFLIIADQPPSLQLKRLTFIKWNLETEIEDLLKIDIGIMPLPDDEWSKGKCGFKALQYMSLEIPCVISPVGVNEDIIDHGENGFLAATQNEWVSCLSKIIEQPDIRQKIGIMGRQKIINQFSIESNRDNFLSLFS